MCWVLEASRVERDDFQWCGKCIRKCKDTGEIKISMVPYHQSLKPVVVGRERRKDPSALLTSGEIKKLKGIWAIWGSLQWLVAQLRFDISFQVSSLPSETPTVGTLLRANKCLVKDYDYEMTFRGVDFAHGGILGASWAPSTLWTSDFRSHRIPRVCRSSLRS